MLYCPPDLSSVIDLLFFWTLLFRSPTALLTSPYSFSILRSRPTVLPLSSSYYWSYCRRSLHYFSSYLSSVVVLILTITVLCCRPTVLLTCLLSSRYRSSDLSSVVALLFFWHVRCRSPTVLLTCPLSSPYCPSLLSSVASLLFFSPVLCRHHNVLLTCPLLSP